MYPLEESEIQFDKNFTAWWNNEFPGETNAQFYRAFEKQAIIVKVLMAKAFAAAQDPDYQN